jgi:alpha-beta hydrolase superfamily lysophospholipase
MTALPLVRTFIDNQGIEITFYEWPVAHPKGVVQIVHGLGEHGRRYDHVAEHFNRAGYSVYADDHRGHGETGFRMQANGDIKQQGNLGPGGMGAVFSGVRSLSHIILGENPEEPLILFGHSWGSMIAQRIFNNFSDEYDAMILSGSTLLLPGVLPSSGFNKRWDNLPGATGGEWLSRDHEVGRAFREDPKNFPESAIKAFGVTNVVQLLGVPSRDIDAHVPILLIAGSDDAIGGEKGNRLLANAYRRVGVDDLQVLVYHGARHEVHNETNKDEVLTDVVSWLDERFAVSVE